MKNNSEEQLVKFFLNTIIFISIFIMGMQFSSHYFISKESLIGPAFILLSVLIYYLFYNRNIFMNKSSFLIISISTIYFVYYISNVNSKIPLKLEYMTYLSIIFLLFFFISTFKNKIIQFPMWIVFIFIYSNIIFLPRLLAHMSFTHANSNGIIALLLLFFCMINLNVSNKILRIMNIYNTLFLIIVLFVATSRAAMMAFILIILIYLVATKLHKYFLPFIAIFVVVSQSFTLFYIQAKGTALGNKLEELSRHYTGKKFFSGRDRIWKDSMDEVIQSGNIWTGLGNNVQHGEFNGYLHNAYVQLFYQSGLIGLLLMTGLILAIAFIASKVKVQAIDHSFKTLSAFFIGILFLQVFEGHLIYKFEIITVLCWLIIALFVNKIISLNIAGESIK